MSWDRPGGHDLEIRHTAACNIFWYSIGKRRTRFLWAIDTSPGFFWNLYRACVTDHAYKEVDMLTFDRIVLTILALGIWALVLSPRSIEAHHIFAVHDCDISGRPEPGARSSQFGFPRSG